MATQEEGNYTPQVLSAEVEAGVGEQPQAGRKERDKLGILRRAGSGEGQDIQGEQEEGSQVAECEVGNQGQ